MVYVALPKLKGLILSETMTFAQLTQVIALLLPIWSVPHLRSF
jgi:hypothetical protein